MTAEKIIPGFEGEIKENEPFAKVTTYQVGGPARYMVTPYSRADLEKLVPFIQATKLPIYIFGLGSNLLVSDDGFPGIAIRMNRINLKLESVPADDATGGHWIEAGASAPISMLLRKASREGWDGLEGWTGIPGTIGGAVFMNAGTHLSESKDLVEKVETFDFDTGEFRIYEKSQLKFGYRENGFLSPHESVITAWVRHHPAPAAEVDAKISGLLKRRKETQPIDLPSCGSVFRNPKAHGKKAWEVIESLGLKGHRIGGAEFSPKHCNFIVNVGGAKASDIRALIELAKSRALAELGIPLQEEVRICP
jgi:UDP-N-acetylmuramate dehydrogenase